MNPLSSLSIIQSQTSPFQSFFPFDAFSTHGLCKAENYPIHTPIEDLPSLENLQQEIDTLNWTEKLSATPPKPSRSYPIKEQEAANWVHGHVCEKQRVAAQKLIQATRHVGQAEFESELKKSVYKFNQWLEEQGSKDYVLVVTKQFAKKSNRWVAELALPHLKKLPTEVLSISNLEVTPELLSYQKEHPEIKKFVFFDDAAYGCSQSKYTVNELSNLDLFNECGKNQRNCSPEREQEILNTKKDYTVIAVIPFMRDPTCILPGSNVHEISFPKVKVESHIRVFTSQKMNTVGAFLSPEESSSIGCAQDKLPVYFDHKMPDYVSTCSQIFEEGKILHLWETCEEDFPELSTWQKIVNWISGVNINKIAWQRTMDRTQQIESSRPKVIKFIDEIKPPYK